MKNNKFSFLVVSKRIVTLCLLFFFSIAILSQDSLDIKDLKQGTGKEAKKGSNVKVHYTGWLAVNNKKFDSSLDRKVPFEFKLGRGEVIPGWDRGVVGMKEGGKRKLTIPSVLGYGENGTANIPPNSTLIFEVELLQVD
jgi:FKBP-type peptidyl-prolyl cis-trans isomerase